MKARYELVRELIEHGRPPKEVLDDLQHYRWDCEQPLMLVTASDVSRVLGQFLDDQLGYIDVELWADAIEVREDLNFESELVREVVFALANPALEGELSRGAATKLKAKLGSVA